MEAENLPLESHWQGVSRGVQEELPGLVGWIIWTVCRVDQGPGPADEFPGQKIGASTPEGENDAGRFH